MADPEPRAQQAAQFLFDLRQRRVPPARAIPDAFVPRTLDEAYWAQRAFLELRRAELGGGTIGYKIACTSEIAQASVGVPPPVFGSLLAATSFSSPHTLPADTFRVRCVESEFAFRIGKDVPGDAPVTRASILPYIDAVLPGIEIVDHYFEDWAVMGSGALVADNCIHGAWVHGAPRSPTLATELVDQPVTLRANGVVVQTGTGAAALGDPLRALVWLANELASRQRVLRAGDYVTTGITTGIYFAAPGDRLQADFGAVGAAELTLASNEGQFSCAPLGS